MMQLDKTLIILFYLPVFFLSSQNDFNNWHFGKYCGLDFATNPPAILSTSAYTNQTGGASVSDTAGNLLFYASGSTVWNKSDVVMANGILFSLPAGNTQQPIIVRQPGSTNIFFIFYFRNTLSMPWEWRYALVDMSLAAGMGSVTAKDLSLYSPACSGMAAAFHCNGTDVWLTIHERYSSNFRSYQLGSGGLNLLPVVSSAGPVFADSSANIRIKISHNRKRAVLLPSSTRNAMLFDFDPLSGIFSNHFTLMATNSNTQGWWGGEFSPDCTKLYCNTKETSGYRLFQWNLAAGSPSAIVSSSVLLQTNFVNTELQLAKNGKIYIAAASTGSLNVINSPNAPGSGINYSVNMQSVGNGTVLVGLPNIISGPFRQKPSITSAVSCRSATFTIPAIQAGTGYSVTGIQWNFGDPSSGQNLSNLSNPVHDFSASGDYTAMCVVQYDCGSDTLKHVLNVNADPVISVSGKTIYCSGETGTLTASGADTYTWSNGIQAISTVVTPTTGVALMVSGTSSVTSCTGSKIVNLILTPCLSLNEADEHRLLFYPNPANSFLNFSIHGKADVIISDLTGRQVLKYTLEGENGLLDISGLDAGVYVLKAASSRFSRSSFIIVKH